MYEVFEHLLQSYGVSAYRFCKETGISQSTISTWKKKGNLIKGDLAKKIADYFNVSVEQITNSLLVDLLKSNLMIIRQNDRIIKLLEER